MEIVVSSKSSKHLNETNLLKSENFEESLEDIEAEAEICSPTKSISHDDIKQKKKSKSGLNLIVYDEHICIYFFVLLKENHFLVNEGGLKKKKVHQKIKKVKKMF